PDHGSGVGVGVGERRGNAISRVIGDVVALVNNLRYRVDGEKHRHAEEELRCREAERDEVERRQPHGQPSDFFRLKLTADEQERKKEGIPTKPDKLNEWVLQR